MSRTILKNDVARYVLAMEMSDGTLQLLPPGCTKVAVGLADGTVATLDNGGLVTDPTYHFALTGVKPQSITEIRPLQATLPSGQALTVDSSTVESVIVAPLSSPPGIPPTPKFLRALIVL